MGYDVVTGLFCASWFAAYDVPGSGGATWRVELGGGEGPCSCTCPAFRHHRGPASDRECKHVRRVHAEACLWNCQWSDGNRPVLLRPAWADLGNAVRGERCPNCGGPAVAVRIAV